MVSKEVIGANIYSLTGSPESIRNLARYRGCIKGDMAAPDRRLLAIITDGNRQFVAKSTRAAIMEPYAASSKEMALDKIVRPCATSFISNGTAGCAQQSTENGANTAGIKQGELVERTPFPTFNKSQEERSKFKRVFQEWAHKGVGVSTVCSKIAH